MPTYKIEAIAKVRRHYTVTAADAAEARRKVECEGIPYLHEEDETEEIESVEVVEINAAADAK